MFHPSRWIRSHSLAAGFDQGGIVANLQVDRGFNGREAQTRIDFAALRNFSQRLARPLAPGEKKRMIRASAIIGRHQSNGFVETMLRRYWISIVLPTQPREDHVS